MRCSDLEKLDYINKTEESLILEGILPNQCFMMVTPESHYDNKYLTPGCNKNPNIFLAIHVMNHIQNQIIWEKESQKMHERNNDGDSSEWKDMYDDDGGDNNDNNGVREIPNHAYFHLDQTSNDDDDEDEDEEVDEYVYDKKIQRPATKIFHNPATMSKNNVVDNGPRLKPDTKYKLYLIKQDSSILWLFVGTCENFSYEEVQKYYSYWASFKKSEYKLQKNKSGSTLVKKLSESRLTAEEKKTRKSMICGLKHACNDNMRAHGNKMEGYDISNVIDFLKISNYFGKRSKFTELNRVCKFTRGYNDTPDMLTINADVVYELDSTSFKYERFVNYIFPWVDDAKYFMTKENNKPSKNRYKPEISSVELECLKGVSPLETLIDVLKKEEDGVFTDSKLIQRIKLFDYFIHNRKVKRSMSKAHRSMLTYIEDNNFFDSKKYFGVLSSKRSALSSYTFSMLGYLKNMLTFSVDAINIGYAMLMMLSDTFYMKDKASFNILIIGSHGAGKSDLLKIMKDLYPGVWKKSGTEKSDKALYTNVSNSGAIFFCEEAADTMVNHNKKLGKSSDKLSVVKDMTSSGMCVYDVLVYNDAGERITQTIFTSHKSANVSATNHVTGSKNCAMMNRMIEFSMGLDYSINILSKMVVREFCEDTNFNEMKNLSKNIEMMCIYMNYLICLGGIPDVTMDLNMIYLIKLMISLIKTSSKHGFDPRSSKRNSKIIRQSIIKKAVLETWFQDNSPYKNSTLASNKAEQIKYCSSRMFSTVETFIAAMHISSNMYVDNISMEILDILIMMVQKKKNEYISSSIVEEIVDDNKTKKKKRNRKNNKTTKETNKKRKINPSKNKESNIKNNGDIVNVDLLPDDNDDDDDDDSNNIPQCFNDKSNSTIYDIEDHNSDIEECNSDHDSIEMEEYEQEPRKVYKQKDVKCESSSVSDDMVLNLIRESCNVIDNDEIKIKTYVILKNFYTEKCVEYLGSPSQIKIKRLEKEIEVVENDAKKNLDGEKWLINRQKNRLLEIILDNLEEIKFDKLPIIKPIRDLNELFKMVILNPGINFCVDEKSGKINLNYIEFIFNGGFTSLIDDIYNAMTKKPSRDDITININNLKSTPYKIEYCWDMISVEKYESLIKQYKESKNTTKSLLEIKHYKSSIRPLEIVDDTKNENGRALKIRINTSFWKHDEIMFQNLVKGIVETKHMEDKEIVLPCTHHQKGVFYDDGNMSATRTLKFKPNDNNPLIYDLEIPEFKNFEVDEIKSVLNNMGMNTNSKMDEYKKNKGIEIIDEPDLWSENKRLRLYEDFFEKIKV